MLSFWVLAGLLACAAVALVAWPLVRRADPSLEDEARRLAVYRDRRDEIRRELEAGRLSAEEAQRAEDELIAEAARQFDTGTADASRGVGGVGGTGAGRGGRAGIAWTLVVALAIPLSAVGVYRSIGAPALVTLDAATLRGELTPERIAQAIAELEKRVAAAPQDGEAWAMLAEASRLNDDPGRAAEAYGKATALQPDNARLLADYAETLVIVSQGDFSGRPVELLERALRADPDDGKALALMAAAQYKLGNPGRALKLLEQLASALPPDSEELRRLSGAMRRIEADIAARGTAAQPGDPGAAGDRKTASGPRNAAARGVPGAEAPGRPDSRAAADRDPAATRITGTIALDASLGAAPPPGATVFVVARAAEGPRMPIAVQRLEVGKTWPLRFELSDAQAMDASRKLSSFGQVVVEARISASGDAARRSGDPFGVSGPLQPGAREVALRIDQRVP